MTSFGDPTAGEMRRRFWERRDAERDEANSLRIDEAVEAGRCAPEVEDQVLARHAEEEAAERAEDERTRAAEHDVFSRAVQTALGGTRDMGCEQNSFPPERMTLIADYIEAQEQTFWERQWPELDDEELEL